MKRLAAHLAVRVAAGLALLAACGTRSPAQGNQPPVPVILAPADGATVPAGAPVTLSGSAQDAKDGALTGVQLVWSSDVQGQLGAGQSLSVTLQTGAHRISLTATDSLGLSAVAQISVTAQAAQNTAPQAFIDAPRDGASFDEGKPIALAGHGTDLEDGAIPSALLSWTSSIDGAIGAGAQLAWSAPSRGTHRLLLTATDKGGLSGYATVTITVVPAGSNHAPTAAITSPHAGDQFTQGSPVQLSGSGTDVEDGALSGAHLAWTSSLDGALGTGASLSISTLRLGAHTITLTATDSLGATGTAQVLISVVQPGNTAPTAVIDSPRDGSAFFTGDTIAFHGSATDLEDGAISNLAWSSSIDGALGTGASLSVSTLHAGTHRITLTATDSQGAQGAAQITVSVLPQNQPPVATITSPLDGSFYDAGTTVQLRGSAQDPEDGAIPSAQLQWTSSLDGTLGTGGSLDTASLRAGSHVISLTATDSGGRTGSAQVSITVRPTQTNLPPVARLSVPAQGVSGVAVAIDGSASSDSDGSIASYDFDFGDGSPHFTSGATTTHAYAQAGTYVVTLVVTDNQGATGSASASIAVSAPVHLPIVLDAGPALGGRCAVRIAPSGTVYVAYLDQSHPSLWLATVSAQGTSTEQVDGMGYEVGGSIDTNLALAVDAQGAPHLAYALQNHQLWYATSAGGAWLRERVDGTSLRAPSSYSEAVSIAFSPSGPSIAYGAASSVVLASRTGPGAWTNTPLSFAGLYYANVAYFQGGLAFDASGTAFLSLNSGYDYVASWNGSASQIFQLPASGENEYGPLPLSLDASGKPVLLAEDTVLHVSPGASGLATATATSSPFETQTSSYGDVAVDGLAYLAYGISGELFLAQAPLDQYWQRTDLGPMDAAFAGVAADGQGARVCFFRSGKLLLY